jgi:hypothetical protein
MTMKMIETISKIKPQMIRFLVFFNFGNNFQMRLVSMICNFFILVKKDEPHAPKKELKENIVIQLNKYHLWISIKVEKKTNVFI